MQQILTQKNKLQYRAKGDVRTFYSLYSDFAYRLYLRFARYDHLLILAALLVNYLLCYSALNLILFIHNNLC